MSGITWERSLQIGQCRSVMPDSLTLRGPNVVTSHGWSRVIWRSLRLSLHTLQFMISVPPHATAHNPKSGHDDDVRDAEVDFDQASVKRTPLHRAHAAEGSDFSSEDAAGVVDQSLQINHAEIPPVHRRSRRGLDLESLR